MSATSSTVGRWRPAVLALTAASAGLALWYLHKINYASTADKPPATGLHRSNAVRRSRERRTARRTSDAAATRLGESEPITAEDLRAAYYGMPEFGDESICVEDLNGARWAVCRGNLRRLRQRLSTYNQDSAQRVSDAQRVMELFEKQLLFQLMDLLDTHNHPLRDRGGLRAFVSVLIDGGFQERGVVEAVLRSAIAIFLMGSGRGEEYGREHGLDRARYVDLHVDDHRIPSEALHRIDSMFEMHAGTLDEAEEEEVAAEAMATFLEGLHEEAENHELNGTEGVDGADDDTEASWEFERDGDEGDVTKKDGQSLLNMLYHIAEDQSRRDGYIHRGVSCNSCNVMPIRGIRYRCSNCPDFDLCEQCEALQNHPKTHLMYKIRIPAPFLDNSQPPQAPLYPGKMGSVLTHLPRNVSKQLSQETGRELAEIEALWDTFKCLANVEWPEDPLGFGVAVDRQCFDQCFLPSTKSIRRPPNLPIHDRLFAFFDRNKDQKIGFKEFVMGIATIRTKDRATRIRRSFWVYDFDEDGWVSRKDFLLMFRSYFALSKELTLDMLQNMEEDVLEGATLRDTLKGTQPISSTFTALIPAGQWRRNTNGKIERPDGERVISDGGGVVADSDEQLSSYWQIVADVREEEEFGNLCHIDKARSFIDSQDDSHTFITKAWPPFFITKADAAPFFPSDATTLSDITNLNTRRNIVTSAILNRQDVRQAAVKARFNRQRFYSSSDPTVNSRRYVTNGVHHPDGPSSEPRTVAGGPHPNLNGTASPTHSPPSPSIDRQDATLTARQVGPPIRHEDAGQEYLYEILQESLNELLDPLFRLREDLSLLAESTKLKREAIREDLDAFGTEPMRRLCREQVLDPDLFSRNLAEQRAYGAELEVEAELRRVLEWQDNSAEPECIANLTHMAAAGVIDVDEYQRRANAMAESSAAAAAAALETLPEPAASRFRAARLNGHAARSGSASVPGAGAGASGGGAGTDEVADVVNAASDLTNTLANEAELPDVAAAEALDAEIQAVVDAFGDADAAVKAVEELLSSQSFDNLLASSGYAVEGDRGGAEDGTVDDEDDDSSEEEEERREKEERNEEEEEEEGEKEEEEEEEEGEGGEGELDLSESSLQAQRVVRFDPTMPQNKPNTLDMPNGNVHHEKGENGATSRETEESGVGGTSTTNGVNQASTHHEKDGGGEDGDVGDKLLGQAPLSQQDLKFHLMLDCISEADRRRGGPGRLNGVEFEKVMNGIRGRRLEFLGMFFELVTF